MGLRNSLEKVGEVIEHIIYSDRDVSYIDVLGSGYYIPIGGKCKVPMKTDAGEGQIIKYSSSNDSIATVSDGWLIGKGVGDATITIKSYNITASYTVHVGKEINDTSAIPEQDRIIDQIEIVNPRGTLEVGDEYALQAVGISNSLGVKYDISYYNPIKWSSSDPSVAGVMLGTLVAYKVGTCTITATDLNGTSSASFTLTVVPAQVIPQVSASETYTPEIDNTGETDVTADIAEAFAYAANNGYKKILFAGGKFKVNADSLPDNAPIEFPSDMVVDFNGGEIYIEEGELSSSGYTLFSIKDVENLWLENLTIIGENYNRETLIRQERCRTLLIDGDSRNVHIEHSRFAWSPGFNTGITRVWNQPYMIAWLRLQNVEAGNLDSNGQPIAAQNTWRSINYFGGSEIGHGHDHDGYTLPGNEWTFGSYQGNQVAYIRSRLYDIYFYDDQYNFLYRKQDCYMYQKYKLPENIHPTYYKVVFFQEDAPTAEQNEYGMAWLVNIKNPEDIYFYKCTFDNNMSTGLSPQGGVHVVVDSCTFVDNGMQDPFSHIDWENGLQTSQGHIIKNCIFKKDRLTYYAYGQIINGYCRNITFHDNTVYDGALSSWSESTMFRCFHNVFIDGAVTIGGKCDSIFAGNLSTLVPTINPTDIQGTYNISADNEIIT